MRRIIATIALMALALPALATECTQIEIGYVGDSPYVASRVDAPGIRTAIVGQFIHIQYRPGGADSTGDDLVSVKIDGATAASVCSNGTVTLTHPSETPSAPSETPDTPAVDEVDLADVYADIQPFIDALLRYRPY